MEKDFLSSRNNVFFVVAIFLLVETTIGMWGKQFSRKELNITGGQLIFWLVQNHFFSKFIRFFNETLHFG